MKLVIIGGGSYVFAPMAIHDAIEAARLAGSEIVLVDVDADVLQAMGNYAKSMAKTLGVDIKVSMETDRKKALPGADFVIMSAVVQGAKRWLTDFEILKGYGIAHLNRENGGVGGLSYGMRQIKLVMDICADMEACCPDAVFLDASNPMPMLVNAINNHTKFTAYGFCSVAWRAPDGYRWLANMLGRDKDEISAVSAGLNHFSWFMSIRDKKTGEDLYDEAVKQLMAGSGAETDTIKRWYVKYGAIIAGGVDHHAEYLPYDPEIKVADHVPFHGSGSERQDRITLLKDVANGKKDYKEALLHGSWEHPVLLADAIYNKKTVNFDMINVQNKGYIKGLPDGLTVEVPVSVVNGAVQPSVFDSMPDRLLNLLRGVAKFQNMAVSAIVKKDINLLKNVIDEDDAILPDEKEKAKTALMDVIRAHNDLINWM